MKIPLQKRNKFSYKTKSALYFFLKEKENQHSHHCKDTRFNKQIHEERVIEFDEIGDGYQ